MVSGAPIKAGFVRPGADVTGTAALSLALGLLPMNWIWTSVLTVALCVAVLDFIYRPWTAGLRVAGRAVLSGAAIAMIGYQMYPTVLDRFDSAYQIGKYAHVVPLKPKPTPPSKPVERAIRFVSPALPPRVKHQHRKPKPEPVSVPTKPATQQTSCTIGGTNYGIQKQDCSIRN